MDLLLSVPSPEEEPKPSSPSSLNPDNMSSLYLAKWSSSLVPQNNLCLPPYDPRVAAQPRLSRVCGSRVDHSPGALAVTLSQCNCLSHLHSFFSLKVELNMAYKLLKRTKKLVKNTQHNACASLHNPNN